MNLVTCATKKGDNYDPYERITHLGGNSSKGNFYMSAEEMMKDIESGDYTYWVNVGGNQVRIIIATRNGRAYLKTEADSYEPNNLLALGDCT